MLYPTTHCSLHINEARSILRDSTIHKFPSGAFRRGDGDFNQCGNCCWNWHIDPAAVEFVEVAIEACDGKPSIDTVRRYCP